MGTQLGMRGKDFQKVLIVARELNVTILVRHTNEHSLKFVQKPGFYPKPAVVKAKTADFNPPDELRLVNGVRKPFVYDVAGLVVHPGFLPACFEAEKAAKAQHYWTLTMQTLSPALAGTPVDLLQPETWKAWGSESMAIGAPRWKWRVDIDRDSPRFGCLQLYRADIGWCYIHGDYDLKDVIVRGRETENVRAEGTLDGVANFTPLLYNLTFEKVQDELNRRMGVDMVQHGAEAQFAWHGDEPITVAFPDGQFVILGNAITVQSWYEEQNRKLLAKPGEDYRRNHSRMFHFGPDGMFAPLIPPIKPRSDR
jgi:hypothetical protein